MMSTQVCMLWVLDRRPHAQKSRSHFMTSALQDEILDLLSEEFDTQYEIEDSADRLFTEDTFKNRAVAPLNGGQAGGTWASLLGGVDLVSSDTDDDSYRCLGGP